MSASANPPDDTDPALRQAARQLLEIRDKFPEMWRHIMSGVSDEDIETLHELAYGDEEDET